MDKTSNRVILDMQTYQEIFERIEKLENSESHQEILSLTTRINNLERQKKILLDKIREQEKWHNLFYYEQSLRSRYEKTLSRITHLSLPSRIFRYKKILKNAMRNTYIN